LKKFSSLPKNKKIVIAVVAAVILAAVISIAIVLPLILTTQKEPEISFGQFDRLSDNSVTVNWNKVRGAKKYYVEFCYGSIKAENTAKLTTDDTAVYVTRQTGILSVRVAADNGHFSDWKSLDIPPLKLRAPTSLTISGTNLKASWTTVYYDYYGTRTPVSKYSYDIGFDGEYNSMHFQTIGEPETESFATYVKLYIERFYDEETAVWEDVVFNIRVKAVTGPKYSASETESEIYLKNAYEDSEYTEQSIIITKDIYEGLMKYD